MSTILKRDRTYWIDAAISSSEGARRSACEDAPGLLEVPVELALEEVALIATDATAAWP